MIRLALIGAGRWGRNIIRTLNGIKGCHLKYICDPSVDLPHDKGGLRGVGRNYTYLLKQEDIDGVIVATPGSTHAKIALPFINKGIPTFVEKPMSTSLRDALMLERAAKKSGAIVFVGHLHLYNPAYQKTKSLIRNIGKIRLLTFESMNNGPIRSDMSALWDWAPHDVAMALDLLGSKPIYVQALGEKILRPQTKLYDFATIRLLFPAPSLRLQAIASAKAGPRSAGEAIPVFIHLSWLSPEKRKKLTILGTKDAIVLDDTLENGKITLYKNMGPSLHPPLTKGGYGGVTTTSHPKYGASSPLETELRAFLKSIRVGQQPMTDIKNGVDVTRIINAAEKSIKLDRKKIRL